jgi:hypothetical protein
LRAVKDFARSALVARRPLLAHLNGNPGIKENDGAPA